MVSSDSSWSEHVNETVNKANKLLALVHRTVGSSNPGAFSTLYKSLVRPVLEYAAPAWNPYLSLRRCASVRQSSAKSLPACSWAKT